MENITIKLIIILKILKKFCVKMVVNNYYFFKRFQISNKIYLNL